MEFVRWTCQRERNSDGGIVESCGFSNNSNPLTQQKAFPLAVQFRQKRGVSWRSTRFGVACICQSVLIMTGRSWRAQIDGGKSTKLTLSARNNCASNAKYLPRKFWIDIDSSRTARILSWIPVDGTVDHLRIVEFPLYGNLDVYQISTQPEWIFKQVVSYTLN